jgi:DNA-binding NtrC family response regulator
MDRDPIAATVVLFGLEPPLAAELGSVLEGQHQKVYSEPFVSAAESLRVVERLGAELVFCTSERSVYMSLLEAVGRHKPDLPVVIVSRTPEVSEWLDAIEAGASDYCAAPFESGQIKWILDSTLKHRSSPALYRAGS